MCASKFTLSIIYWSRAENVMKPIEKLEITSHRAPTSPQMTVALHASNMKPQILTMITQTHTRNAFLDCHYTTLHMSGFSASNLSGLSGFKKVKKTEVISYPKRPPCSLNYPWCMEVSTTKVSPTTTESDSGRRLSCLECFDKRAVHALDMVAR